jgi:tetratricopeptide (TPR) repeat protein
VIRGCGWARAVRARLRVGCLVGLGLAAAGSELRASASPTSAEITRLPGAGCPAPSVEVWPTTARARAAQLEVHLRVLPACLEDAPFLAVLGALLLEDGQAEQAVLWLERSLLLDPNNLGAQADFAIALATLGEPGPAAALWAAWAERGDVPAALRERLRAATGRDRFALPPARFGRDLAASRWRQQGEISLMAGHEDNLDRSPRLTELTLTIADGPIVLPVTSTPRGGGAALLSASYQFAYAASSRVVVRSGVSASGRQSSREPATDWRQYQWASSAAYQRAEQRLQFDALVAWVEGPLGEPFRQTRLSLSGEQEALGCRAKLGAEAEQRRQSRSVELDAGYRGWAAGVQCDAWRGRIGLSWLSRGGTDEPDAPSRPGGKQRIRSDALRLTALLPADIKLELSGRYSRSDDSVGYSPLLESNAIRTIRLRQFGVDLSWPVARYLPGVWRTEIDAVLQLQGSRQSSNLTLFGYRADSGYLGLRWSW